ncbi:MAG: OsmC family protein [Gemmatimonadota bacterium]|jgi:putative redox protein
MDLITVTRQSDLAFTVRLRGHELTTDMSVPEGGHDTGPNPVELLGAACGACLGIMVQTFCNERGYTDGDVGVSLTLELADGPKRVVALVADVELPAGIPEEAREELRALARQFPIPATLQECPRVDIEFV